jgi:Putative Ig domain
MAGCVLLAIVAVGLVGVPRAAADTQFLQSVASSTLPAGALANDELETYATACDATNECVAVGQYETASSDQAMVMAITDGVPGAEMKVTLPANADTSSQSAELNGVSCQSAALCTAIGFYEDSLGDSEPMVVEITGGVPSPAVGISLPANAENNHTDYLEGVSCPSSGTCEAVGYYNLPASVYAGLVVPITAGGPAPGVQITPPSNSEPGNPANELYAVACQTSASCTAVGFYYGAAGDTAPLAVVINNGAPGTAVEAAVPQNYSGSPDGWDEYVACPASGACETVGYYYDHSDTEQLMAEPITSGSPGMATEISVPNTHSSSDAYIVGMSCSSASMCEASGYYTDTSGLYQGLEVPITNSGASGNEITPPAGVVPSSSEVAGLYGVACVPSGPCLSDGWYSVGNDEYGGLQVQTSASGSVSDGVALPEPSGASTTAPYTFLQGIGCDSSEGSCVAVGISEYTASDYDPYVVSEQAPLSISTTSLSGAAVGASYQAQLAATGAWGAYAWSVTSGTLPAGLSLNAQTGAITGSPSAGGTFTFTVGVTGTGSPVQTAQQSLSLTVAAPQLQILGGSGLVNHNRLGVELACWGAACSGTVKVEKTVLVTIKHGKKRVRKHRTVVLGSVGYTATAGQTETLNITLNGAGRRALAAAKKHRLSVTIVATVSSGKAASRGETIHAASKPKKKKKKGK